MYIVKKQSINNGEEFLFRFDVAYPIKNGALWVRPADEPNTPMIYELEFLYSGESQVLRNRTSAAIDLFKFELIPANKSIYEYWNFPLQLQVRIKNTSGTRKNFYCALIAKQLDEQG